jgi:hypothetical protein
MPERETLKARRLFLRRQHPAPSRTAQLTMLFPLRFNEAQT